MWPCPHLSNLFIFENVPLNWRNDLIWPRLFLFIAHQLGLFLLNQICSQLTHPSDNIMGKYANGGVCPQLYILPRRRIARLDGAGSLNRIP